MIPVWTETANKVCEIGYYEYKNQEKAIKYLTIMLWLQGVRIKNGAWKSSVYAGFWALCMWIKYSLSTIYNF